MEEFKIKKIKNLNDVKEIFSFISFTFFQDSIKCGEDFIPLHELYEIMVDNLAHNKEFQFYGTYNKKVVGALVASPLPYDPTCLLVNVLFVNGASRQNGYAKKLLAEIEIVAKKYGFKKIRAIYTDNSNSFFTKNKYDLYLELAIPETLSAEEVILLNDLNLKRTNLLKYNDINFVQYTIETPDARIKNFIHRNSPLVKAIFYLEKILDYQI